MKTWRYVALWAPIAAVGGAIAAAAGSSKDLLLLAAVGLITAVQVGALRRASRQPVPLPAVTVVAINAVGVLGWIYYPSVAQTAAVSARLPETPLVYGTAAQVFAAASAAVFAGGLAAGRMVSGRPISPTEVAAHARTAIGSAPGSRLTLFAVLPLLVVVTAYTPSALLARAHYSDALGPAPLVRVGSMLVPVGMALSALLWARAPRGRRTGPGLLVLAYAVVVFATGSRGLAMLPVLLFLAWLLHRPSDRSDPGRASVLPRALACVAATTLFLQIPLTMRGQSHGAGLGPYLDLLQQHPSLLLTIDLPRITGNVLFAVPLAGVVAHEVIPTEWLATSLSPLPSSFTNWATIRGELRVNGYTPYSGLGELAAHGMPVLVAAMFAFGAVAAALQQWNSRLPSSIAAAATVVGVGLIGAPTLALLQYNLRAGSRYVWYFAALSIVVHAVVHLRTAPAAAGSRAPAVAVGVRSR